MQIRISFWKFVTPKEYKKCKIFHFQCNTFCREHFKFKVLSANRVKPEIKFFALFVLLRGHKFSKWNVNLHNICQTIENLNFHQFPERAQTISDTLVSSEHQGFLNYGLVSRTPEIISGNSYYNFSANFQQISKKICPLRLYAKKKSPIFACTRPLFRLKLL